MAAGFLLSGPGRECRASADREHAALCWNRKVSRNAGRQSWPRIVRTKGCQVDASSTRTATCAIAGHRRPASNHPAISTKRPAPADPRIGLNMIA
jgi:hypothetical protein